MVSYNDVVLPFGYEIVHKDVSFSDIKTRKVKRKASTSKNEHFRNLIQQSIDNKVLFDHVLADNWFGSKENMQFIHGLDKKFILGVKSNRTVALSDKDKKEGKFQQVSSLNMMVERRIFFYPFDQENLHKRRWISRCSIPCI